MPRPESITPNLIINSPNNPAGTLYSQEAIEAFAPICKQNNIIVISDEIYAGVSFTNKTCPSFIQHYPEKTIVTAGLSKLFSAGRYRLGVAISPKHAGLVANALKTIISETTSCTSAPIHRTAANYLYNAFTAMGLLCAKPQGAFHLFPSFNLFCNELTTLNINTSTQLADHLLQEYKITTLLGTDFYCEPDDLTLRIATVDYDGNAILDQDKPTQDNANDLVQAYLPNLPEDCRRLKTLLLKLTSARLPNQNHHLNSAAKIE